LNKILLHNPQLSKEQRVVAIFTILIPLIGTILSAAWIIIAFVLYLCTTCGLSVGFHRLFTHKAFKPSYVVKVTLAIMGMMAAEGPVLFWVASHRRHHAFSDTKNDCHSPCLHGDRFPGRLKGLWHAHFGWMLTGEITNTPMFAKDLLQDQTIIRLNRFYLLWVFIGLAIPAVFGWIITSTIHGVVEGLLIGGFSRIFFVHQVTWGLNSLNHTFGSRRYKTTDQSRNIAWLAVLTMGEGWHNNHHAYPNSAKFGHKWWEFDLGYRVISVLEKIGLCSAVNKPDFTKKS
jgi:stearoyl-CoA desaturase (delta-9 desaturase)